MNLTDEQKLIVDTVNKIAESSLAPKTPEIDREGKFPIEGIKALAEAGFLGMTVPKPLGGSGADTLSYVLAMEAMSKSCPSTGLIMTTHSVVSRAILAAGSDEMKQKYLPDLVTGKNLGALAATEAGSGSNSMGIATKATKDGDEFVINGAKSFITSAGQADVYIVIMRTAEAKAPPQLTAFLIEKDTPGFTVGSFEDTMGLRGTSDGELIFEDCRIPAANMLGPEHGYMEIMPRFLGLGLVGTAGISLGIGQAAVDASIEHAKSREVMGQAIGNYQGLQFMIAEMSTKLTAARSLAYSAAQQMDAPEPPSPFPIYMSKLFATETAIDIAHKALQIHGGTGYSRELPIERYYRDARGLTLHYGPSEALKDVIGKMLLGMFPG
jgi:alkylation response protein AidB-like acyl-CoA dehydrogenase